MRRATQEIRSLNATLEQQVRQRTLHLERANKNLEAFTYSVAHDLRTPLRGIGGFAEALTEDYGDQLDETGRDYAARVQAGCVRMAALIDDLLHLSRVTRAEMNLQDVDLSAVVTAICDQLRARDPGRQVLGDRARRHPGHRGPLPDPGRAGEPARQRLEVHRRPRGRRIEFGTPRKRRRPRVLRARQRGRLRHGLRRASCSRRSSGSTTPASSPAPASGSPPSQRIVAPSRRPDLGRGGRQSGATFYFTLQEGPGGPTP